MNNVEAIANLHADDLLQPLHTTASAGPVLATPAYAAYVAGTLAAFGLGVLSDVCCEHDEDEVPMSGPTPTGGSATQLLEARVRGIK